MVSFISGVLKELISSEENISETIFILPSKRAGSFLLKELSALGAHHIFAPKVYSIEEFTEAVTSTGMIFDRDFIPVNIEALYEAFTSNPEEFKETPAYKFLTQ